MNSNIYLAAICMSFLLSGVAVSAQNDVMIDNGSGTATASSKINLPASGNPVHRSGSTHFFFYPSSANSGFEVNALGGGFEVKSGNNEFSSFDFKGHQNLSADFVGRILHTDNKGFSFLGAPGFPFRVAVEGLLSAKEIKVQSNVWADYVFDPEYDLMSLEELEVYIDSNSRLPGIPSATEVIEKGQNVGELQVRMMEKIEELTLHLIELNKKIDGQAAKLRMLGAEATDI